MTRNDSPAARRTRETVSVGLSGWLGSHAAGGDSVIQSLRPPATRIGTRTRNAGSERDCESGSESAGPGPAQPGRV